MASRLYPANVGLFCQLFKVLVLLGLGQPMSALCVQLACLYVCGLIALFGRRGSGEVWRRLPVGGVLLVYLPTQSGVGVAYLRFGLVFL